MRDKMFTNLLVFCPDSAPYGMSYADWTSKWWRWLLSIPLENNPANDSTGENCTINQSGPVWFLAGTIGGVAKRSCSIPFGLAILMPVLNHGGTLADEPDLTSDDELKMLAIKEMDVISNLEVIVDNMKIPELNIYRVQTPTFNVVLPEGNLFGGMPGRTTGTSNGYWLFLRPLSRGKHKIHTFGSCLAGEVKIGIDYDITIL